MGVCSVCDYLSICPAYASDNIRREVSPVQGANPTDELVYPNTNPDSLDLRCGRNASTAWSQPKTATVRAGDLVGFAAGEPALGVRFPLLLNSQLFWSSRSTAYERNRVIPILPCTTLDMRLLGSQRHPMAISTHTQEMAIGLKFSK